jgi:hypothetical protein
MLLESKRVEGRVHFFSVGQVDLRVSIKLSNGHMCLDNFFIWIPSVWGRVRIFTLSSDWPRQNGSRANVSRARCVFTVGVDERFLMVIYANFGVVLLLTVCVHF